MEPYIVFQVEKWNYSYLSWEREIQSIVQELTINDEQVIAIVTIKTMVSKNIIMGNLFSKMNFLWINIILILFEVQIKHCSGDFNTRGYSQSLFTFHSYFLLGSQHDNRINYKLNSIIW